MTESIEEVPIISDQEAATFDRITSSLSLGRGVTGQEVYAKAVGDSEDPKDPVTYPKPLEEDNGDDDEGDKDPVVSGG